MCRLKCSETHLLYAYDIKQDKLQKAEVSNTQ